MITTQLYVDTEKVVTSLITQLSPTELLDFVKEIDLQLCDYFFTEQVRDYFVEECVARDAIEIERKLGSEIEEQSKSSSE